nr:hypothetical protein [Euryarchaeota archaeon]
MATLNNTGLLLRFSTKRGLAFFLISCFLISTIPTAAACETEVAKALEGKFPSPTGISPNKDDSMRETVRISKIGQETARFLLWEVLMGANYSERYIADEINRVMVENGSNPDWVSVDTIVASGSNGAI